MAGGSNFIWVPFLLTCVFPASDNKHVTYNVGEFVKNTGNPQVDDVLSKIPSINIKLCTDGEAFQLRREVRQLQLKLSTCNLAVTSVAGSYHTQLQTKLNHLLEVIDSENIQALQELQDRKFSELKRKEDPISIVLELISVRNKITVMEKRIKLLTAGSKSKIFDAQRELRQKTELLKKAILLLSGRENDKNLTREILRLQIEVDRLSTLVSNYKTTLEPTITAITVELEMKKKEEAILQKLLENTDHTVAQLIMKIISIMEELREHKQTTTGQQQDILTLLQTYKQDYTNALSEIKTLKEQLLQTREQWSGLEGRYQRVKTELEQRIAQLNKAEDSQAALVVTVINLNGEIKALRKAISTSTDANEIARLKKELLQKQVELETKTADIERLIPSPQNILTIIELQNDIWELQNKDTTGTPNEITVLQQRLDGLLSEIDGTNQNSMKHMMIILTLQSQVEYLQKLLSKAEVSQSHRITQLNKELETKQAELEKVIREINEKNQTNGNLLVTISLLQNQLRQMEKEKESEDKTSSATVSKLREQLKMKEEENEEYQALIKILQIIAVQVELERMASVASNESDYAKITVFQILTQKDEIARLKKEETSQLGAQAEKIKDLENELESIRNQIKEKTLLLETRTTRIANLSAQIMELSEKIVPLQENISDLKQTYKENLAELQERFNFSQKKLQNTESQLEQADARNFKLIMDITSLRAELKKAKAGASKTVKKSVTDLEQQLKTQEKENRKLENANRDLKQQKEELDMCCNANTHCEDVQRQLLQSQEDADRLHQQLQEKDSALKKLQDDFEQQRQEKDRLQEDYDNAVRKLTDVEDRTIYNTKITWDPDTAHPRLVFSANNTEVSTTSHVLQVQNHPGRFDVVLGVLGATGFSRGRHYWEVSVAEKRCYHIGMVSESAKRKGSLSFRPAKGFWTIVLNKQGELKAIDRMSVSLQVERLPITLGILLDYKKGQISFYDSGARSHLYSFSGQEFTDRIYPFLNYCVEDVENPQPIVLLPPGSADWIN
ncbi:uncharacterized protein FYW61_011149 [Anableps anableps]